MVDTSDTLVEDLSGNYLEYVRGIVYLTLARDGKRREVGRIVGDVFYKKENRNGIFKNYKAFGFCYAVIRATLPKWIIVDYRKDRYRVSRETFEEFKIMDTYNHSGYERRAYCPIERFEKKRIAECRKSH